MEFSAQQIASFVGGRIEGNPDASVHTFSKIEEGMPGALSFLSNLKYESYLYTSQSSVILVSEDLVLSAPVTATLIRVKNPYESLAKLMALYESMKSKHVGIDPLASVAPTAKIGKDVYLAPFAVVEAGAEVGDGTQLYPHATVGENAKVGENCILYANTTVYHDCRVGNRCILHAGSVVGADGFGFAPTAEGYDKIPQIGIAILEDDVEIGANACVDRATMGATVVHKGVKIDNLVQVAHNTEVGSNTVLCAQVGIAGSTKIGEWCTLTGQVGVTGHITVADHTTAAAKTGITNNVKKPNQTIGGYPHLEALAWKKSSVIFRNLPEMMAQIRAMQKEIDELKASREK